VEKGATETWTQVEPDPRGGWRVAISLGGSPFRYVFHLAERSHGEDRELLPANVEIEQPDDEPLRPLTAPVVRELADRYDQFQRIAWAAVAFHGWNIPGRKTAPVVRARRALTAEFLRDVVERHDAFKARGLPPTQTLAREEQVSLGTVKHWLRKAREAGIGEAS
jgi:hypothetical protein